MKCELCGHRELPEDGTMLADVALMDNHLRVMHPEEYGEHIGAQLLAHLGATADANVCDVTEEASGARCYKPPSHDGPHNGWAHFPGQLATWSAA